MDWRDKIFFPSSMNFIQTPMIHKLKRLYEFQMKMIYIVQSKCTGMQGNF